jgi:hypothetical protein
MDWLNRITDVFKLQTRYVVLLSLVSGAMLFSPQPILEKLHLSSIPSPYGAIVGIVFLLSTGLVIVNTWSAIASALRHRGAFALRQSKVAESLGNLDPSEQAVLREFILFGCSTLKIPMCNPAVVGLTTAGIIERTGSYGNFSPDGMMFPFRITSIARDLITPEVLGLAKFTIPTESGKMTLTQEGFEWVDERRPEFAIPRRERW